MFLKFAIKYSKGNGKCGVVQQGEKRRKRQNYTRMGERERERERERQTDRQTEGLHVSDNGVMKEGGNIIHVHIFAV